MPAIKHHLRVFIYLFKISIAKQMEYRFNFFLMILIETAFLFVKILYAAVIYQTGVHISGFSSDAIFLFTGTYIIVNGIFMAFFYFNFIEISRSIINGNLDIYLTKPISLQFIMSFKTIDIGTSIPNIVGGFILVCMGWNRMEIVVSIQNIAIYSLLIISGIIICYSIMLFPNLLSFWFGKINALQELTNSLLDFNTMPMTIYSKLIKCIGVYVYPIFLISNYASLYLLKSLSILDMLWGLLAPFVFLILVNLFWRFSLKKYTSASS